MDLELVSSADLTSELLRRYEHGAIVLALAPDDGHIKIDRRWVGNSHTVIGLLVDTEAIVLDNMRQRTT